MPLAVGDTAPEVSHRLGRTDLVRYAGASGDYNPMHHDEIKATKAGQPSVFGHGMLSMAILGRALTDWVGPKAIRSYKVRFVKQTWPGDELTTHVEVTHVSDINGRPTATVDCRLVNQEGDPVVAGTAVLAIDGEA